MKYLKRDKINLKEKKKRLNKCGNGINFINNKGGDNRWQRKRKREARHLKEGVAGQVSFNSIINFREEICFLFLSKR